MFYNKRKTIGVFLNRAELELMLDGTLYYADYSA